MQLDQRTCGEWGFNKRRRTIFSSGIGKNVLIVKNKCRFMELPLQEDSYFFNVILNNIYLHKGLKSNFIVLGVLHSLHVLNSYHLNKRKL